LDITQELKDKAMALKRDHNRAWRRANPDKQKCYELRYWIKKVRAMEEAANGTTSGDTSSSEPR
jgi:hypothetical protein